MKYPLGGIPPGNNLNNLYLLKRHLLISFLLFSYLPGRGQMIYPYNDSAFVRFMDSLPEFEPFDPDHTYQKVRESYQYIISRNDLYDLFGYERYIRFQGFDFNRYHILGQRACRQCLASCEPGHYPCHRNACHYSWVWSIRENTKAFVPEFALSKTGHDYDEIAGTTGRSYKDTVLFIDSSKNQMAWLTTAGGDCHARFDYQLVRDRFFPVLLLKEMNFYGGCRAARFQDYAILFRETGGILYYIKKTLLMEKN